MHVLLIQTKILTITTSKLLKLYDRLILSEKWVVGSIYLNVSENYVKRGLKLVSE